METYYKVNSAAPPLAYAIIKPIFLPMSRHWICRLDEPGGLSAFMELIDHGRQYSVYEVFLRFHRN